MKDGSRQRGIGFPFGKHVDKVAAAARASGGNHGDGNRLAHAGRQLAIEAAAHAILVNGCQHDLSCAALLRLACPSDRVAISRLRSTLHPDAIGAPRPLSIDRHNHRLAAKAIGNRGNELRIHNRSRVDRHLIGAAIKQGGGLFKRSHSAAHGKGHKNL